MTLRHGSRPVARRTPGGALFLTLRAPGDADSEDADADYPKLCAPTAGDRHERELLRQLGEAMTRERGEANQSGQIPAGYTYLGQFLFHDITWSRPPPQLQNRASDSLDLDSVLGNDEFGLAPTETDCPVDGPLAIGRTLRGSVTPSVAWPLPNDLPRAQDDSKPGTPRGFPLTPDVRNDDFLPLAQTHLAILRFYNAIARWQGFNGEYHNVDATRRLTIEHMQAVALHDYCRRLVPPQVYQSVLGDKRRFVHPQPITPSAPFFVPAEIAFAVGRFGHSMIRERYDWNDKHRDASLHNFMEFSHRNRNPRKRPLYAIDHDWVIAWTRFHDFGPVLGAQARRPEPALAIDTHLSRDLYELNECIRAQPQGSPEPDCEYDRFNLAMETLSRHADYGLPSAQTLLATVPSRAKDQEIRPLTPTEIMDCRHPPLAAFLAAHPELAHNTPLWFYVLREAEIIAEREHPRPEGRLGPLGGRLVMETCHAAIEASRISILTKPNWRPALPRASAAQFTMSDLIAFAGAPDPYTRD